MVSAADRPFVGIGLNMLPFLLGSIYWSVPHAAAAWVYHLFRLKCANSG